MGKADFVTGQDELPAIDGFGMSNRMSGLMAWRQVGLRRTFEALVFVGLSLSIGCHGKGLGSTGIHAAPGPAVVGKPAPLFALPDRDGQLVRLKDYRGRWIVILTFRPEDVPSCPCDAGEFNEMICQFRNFDVPVLAVGSGSPEWQGPRSRKYSIEFPILSDEQHMMMDSYGASKPGLLGLKEVRRMTLLVDPTGIIRYQWDTIDPKTHVDTVRRKLAALQG